MSSAGPPPISLDQRVDQLLLAVREANDARACDEGADKKAETDLRGECDRIDEEALARAAGLDHLGAYHTFRLPLALPAGSHVTHEMVRDALDSVRGRVAETRRASQQSGRHGAVTSTVPAAACGVIALCLAIGGVTATPPSLKMALFVASLAAVLLGVLAVFMHLSFRSKSNRSRSACYAAVEAMAKAVALAESYFRTWRRLQRDGANQRWRTSILALRPQFIRIVGEARNEFPAWESLESHLSGVKSVAQSVPFGSLEIRERAVTDLFLEGIPRRQESESPFLLPALLTFPAGGSLLVRMANEGDRQRAVACLQAVMLRVLTTFPPGKARFTIIDPVGLGDNFATFMHLVDPDHKIDLVTARIWTEPRHIEQQLEILTGQMEDVIQKCLRGDYRTIAEYNDAESLAEPYRFLVIANFPARFSPAAAERVLSIAAAGNRCGVYVLMSVDPRQEFPRGFSLDDLEKRVGVVIWPAGNGQDRWEWSGNADGLRFVRPARPPAQKLFSELVESVGQASQNAPDIIIPFSSIAPAAADYWKNNTVDAIVIPLGPRGVNKKQKLILGGETGHHLLIAGQTGMGKSRLMHVLIMNAALTYPPEEVELYLIDFKKGVEFKAYAEHSLPHARVIAVESDREFGVSVLQRLDGVMTERAELYRIAGAADFANYRGRVDSPTLPCVLPRVLLIVDEFQEFFTEDDALAKEARLLLDRLVRQGRSFGVHVVLGSQTLGGAYNLARPTIDQIAVRIALRCSDADSRLILSDDNPAARSLERPGDAIYNHANGKVEGNTPFQVAWLDDDERNGLLDVLRRRAHGGPARPRVVFEGQATADIDAAVFPAGLPVAGVTAVWMGQTVVIRQQPVQATFRRSPGHNLAVIGQDAAAAAGILSAVIVSIAERLPAAAAAAARVYLVDGTPAESEVRVPSGLAPALARRVARQHLPNTIQGILAEVARRGGLPADGAMPPWFLLIQGLQFFRELRRSGDEPLFRRSAEPAPSNTAADLAKILRDGPAVDVHVCVWCDSLANWNRSFDRGMLAEFEMRVVFQMPATDSTTLIDIPWASKLGQYRAFLYDAARGEAEKFRPFGVPGKRFIGHG